MKRKTTIALICSLLICLFVYASVSKLLVYNDFKAALYNQPLPQWSAPILVWLLPVAELVTAGLLMYSRTKRTGVYASAVLMFLFTGYTGLVLANSFGRIPCSCGGILNNMGWKPHLIFNIFFLLLAIAGLVLMKKEPKMQGSSCAPAAS